MLVFPKQQLRVQVSPSWQGFEYEDFARCMPPELTWRLLRWHLTHPLLQRSATLNWFENCYGGETYGRSP